jgi:NAD dependent epimerase/dehydratase family enzyme
LYLLLHRNADFRKTLRKAVGQFIWDSIPTFLTKIGSFIIRTTRTELVLKAENVIPKKLTENGFLI